MERDDPRRKPLNAYLRQCADLMRLQAWDIEVGDREPSPDIAVLAVEPDAQRWWAPIYVRADPTDSIHIQETPEEQRQDVTHELVHIVLWDLWQVIDDRDWRHALSRTEYQAVHAEGLRALEAATDFLARLIAPTLPLPPAFPPRDTPTNGASVGELRSDSMSVLAGTTHA